MRQLNGWGGYYSCGFAAVRENWRLGCFRARVRTGRTRVRTYIRTDRRTDAPANPEIHLSQRGRSQFVSRRQGPSPGLKNLLRSRGIYMRARLCGPLHPPSPFLSSPLPLSVYSTFLSGKEEGRERVEMGDLSISWDTKALPRQRDTRERKIT